jgi:Fic family protein
MAVVNNNHLTQLTSGKFGKEFVFKTRNNDTYLTKYPDRSGVVLSRRQKQSNATFAEAVAFAKEILRDRKSREALRARLKNNKKTRELTVYNAAVQLYMKEHGPAVKVSDAEALVRRYNDFFDLSGRQSAALQYLILEKEMTNQLYQQLTAVSKATATRDLQDMVNQGVLMVTGKGAGVEYDLIKLPDPIHQ